MTHIVSVGGIKGGVGKSTIATNLVIELSRDGYKVLFVDADDQETATIFTTYRNQDTNDNAGYTAIQLSGEAIRTEVTKLADAFDYVVIDVGGRDTVGQRYAMVISDVFLLPFPPRSFDSWTIPRISEMVEEVRVVNEKLQVLSFINKADPSGSFNDDSIELLKEFDRIEFIDTPIGNRKAFGYAGSASQSVAEQGSDPKAIAEFKALYDKILEKTGS